MRVAVLVKQIPRFEAIFAHATMGLRKLVRIPFNLWRLDNCNAGVEKATHNQAKRKAADYFSENFYVTTSGNFSNSALIATLLEIGADPVIPATPARSPAPAMRRATRGNRRAPSSRG